MESINHPTSNIIVTDEITSRKKKKEHQYSYLAYRAKMISVKKRKIATEVIEYHALSTSRGRQMNRRSSPKRAYIVTKVIKIANVQ